MVAPPETVMSQRLEKDHSGKAPGKTVRVLKCDRMLSSLGVWALSANSHCTAFSKGPWLSAPQPFIGKMAQPQCLINNKVAVLL